MSSLSTLQLFSLLNIMLYVKEKISGSGENYITIHAAKNKKQIKKMFTLKTRNFHVGYL